MVITDVREAEKLALEDQVLLKFIKEARHMTEYEYLIDEIDDIVKERLEYITIGYNEGEDKGKIQKEKEIIQKLHSKGLSTENIANTLELKKEYVQRVIKEQINS